MRPGAGFMTLSMLLVGFCTFKFSLSSHFVTLFWYLVTVVARLELPSRIDRLVETLSIIIKCFYTCQRVCPSNSFVFCIEVVFWSMMRVRKPKSAHLAMTTITVTLENYNSTLICLIRPRTWWTVGRQAMASDLRRCSVNALLRPLHVVKHFRMRFFAFDSLNIRWLRISQKPFKMLAMDAKTQKIEPDPNFFLTDESFGGSV